MMITVQDLANQPLEVLVNRTLAGEPFEVDYLTHTERALELFQPMIDSFIEEVERAWWHNGLTIEHGPVDYFNSKNR